MMSEEKAPYTVGGNEEQILRLHCPHCPFAVGYHTRLRQFFRPVTREEYSSQPITECPGCHKPLNLAELVAHFPGVIAREKAYLEQLSRTYVKACIALNETCEQPDPQSGEGRLG